MDRERVSIPLSNGKKLVAEVNPDGDFKEIYIGIEDNGGAWWQDLAIVREDYYWNDDEYGIIPMPGRYEVLVYSDCNNEDWTDSFQIGEYEEEN